MRYSDFNRYKNRRNFIFYLISSTIGILVLILITIIFGKKEQIFIMTGLGVLGLICSIPGIYYEFKEINDCLVIERKAEELLNYDKTNKTMELELKNKYNLN